MAYVIMEIKEELALSDKEFERNYRLNNIGWWKNNSQYHRRVHGAVLCASCSKPIVTPKNLRPYGGKNYDASCFSELVLKEMSHHFSLDHPPDSLRILGFEWGMKVARIMDGGLIRYAETYYSDAETA